MKASQSSLQLLGFFQRLAREVGARSALPLSDGALLFQFGDSDRSVSAKLFWSPVVRPGGVQLQSLSGSLFPQGLSEPEAADIGRKLGAVTGFEEKESLDPLSFQRDTRTPIRLDGQFVERHLAPFLRVGAYWGPFCLVEVLGGERSVRLSFESDSARVVLAVRPADPGQDPQRMMAGPLAVRVVEDTRPSGVARSVPGAVENYLLYALNRSVVSGQPVEAGDGVRPGLDPTAWGCLRESPAARIGENLDETPEDGFFLEEFLRKIGTQETLGTLLEADEGLAVVVHTDRECATKLAWINNPYYCRYLWSRFTPMPISMPARDISWLEPSQIESTMGEESSLRDRIRNAAGDERVRMVVLMGTCVGDVTGLDYQGIISEARPAGAPPVVVVDQMMEHFTEMDEIWLNLFRLAERDADADRAIVNLVGYAPEGSDFARELRSNLPRLGLELNGLLVPSLRTRAIRDFFRAGHTVMNTADGAQQEFRRVRRELAQMNYVDSRPPFGPAGCIRFYDKLRKLAPVSSGRATAEQLWEPYRLHWETWRERARAHEAAVVVRPQDLDCVLNPDRLFGLDLVEQLHEMGFSVRVVGVDGAVAGGAVHVAKVLGEHFEAGLSSDPPLVVQTEPGALDVVDMLGSLGSSIVFTEYPPDHRILDAGKMFFHPRDFEMGFAGALRAIAKLTRLAEGRFGRVLAGGSAETET